MTPNSNADVAARRERLIEQYILALDAADFDTVAQILHEAETDSELDRLLVEVDAALHAEANLPTLSEDAREVRVLLRRNLPSAFLEPETSPPTVGDVAARLQAEHAAGKQLILAGDLHANDELLGNRSVLTIRMTRPAIREFAGTLGVQASERYWERFRRAAIELAMARDQGAPQQAAARPRSPRRRGSTYPTSEQL